MTNVGNFIFSISILYSGKLNAAKKTMTNMTFNLRRCFEKLKAYQKMVLIPQDIQLYIKGLYTIVFNGLQG